jgi:hypothetical protein
MRREKNCGVVAGEVVAVLWAFLKGVMGKNGFWVWCFGGEFVVDGWCERGVSPRVFEG